MWYEKVMILVVHSVIDKILNKRHSEHSVEKWKYM